MGYLFVLLVVHLQHVRLLDLQLLGGFGSVQDLDVEGLLA